jgi:hypothetical protein
MPLITPDVSEVSPAIEAGSYRLRITGVEAGEWKTGTPFLKFEMETCESGSPELDGRKIWHRVPYTGKGAFRFAQMHSAAMGENYESGTIDPEIYLGREVAAVIVDGTDREGNLSGYPEVKTVNAVV